MEATEGNNFLNLFLLKITGIEFELGTYVFLSQPTGPQRLQSWLNQITAKNSESHWVLKQLKKWFQIF